MGYRNGNSAANHAIVIFSLDKMESYFQVLKRECMYIYIVFKKKMHLQLEVRVLGGPSGQHV